MKNTGNHLVSVKSFTPFPILGVSLKMEHPFEFYLEEKHDKSEPEKEIASKSFEKLKTLGYERTFGLHLLHRRRDFEGFETTYLEERANITKFFPTPAVKDEENIKVVWGFKKCKSCDNCKHCLNKTVTDCWSHCRRCHNCRGHKNK
jgi:hypothetical protein